MKKIILIFTVAMFTFLAVNAQTTTSPSQDKDNASGATITFQSLVHDYGTIVKGSNGNCEFTFTNTGTEPLVVNNVTTSCGCTVPSWSKEPILPGNTGVIKVNYTKTDIVGTISKQITVMSNAKNGTIVLSIKGLVVESTTPNTTPDKQTNEVANPKK